jgi:predicted adenylyl cyclase CyaB
VKRNVEIKARAADPDAIRRRAERLSDGPPSVLTQDDTFFHCRDGRLKLRLLSESQAELIHYDRPDTIEPVECRYTVCPCANPTLLLEALSGALGVRGRVRKIRSLYLVNQTRIHVDEVEGLGSYVELEVVLRPEQSRADGERIARAIMRELGIAPRDLIETAYIDLLECGSG